MNKAEYVVKTLSRTKRKDWENYVINRLWNKLDNLELKPVSQQYIKRPEGKYAFIDLYFPQLGIGIECDEMHHLSQEESDKLRYQDIMGAIDNYEEIRIPIFEDTKEKLHFRNIEDINTDIDNAVKKINKQYERFIKNGKFKEWTDASDLSYALSRGYVEVSDNLLFANQEEVRKLFGRKGKTYGKFFYRINDAGDHLWLNYLAIEVGGHYVKPTNKPFLNVLSKDGTTIYESLKDNNVDAIKTEDYDRIVFSRYRDSSTNIDVFRYIGTFHSTAQVEYLDIEGKGKKLPYVVHKKVENKVVF